jgi:hypothetical protein
LASLHLTCGTLEFIGGTRYTTVKIFKTERQIHT